MVPLSHYVIPIMQFPGPNLIMPRPGEQTGDFFRLFTINVTHVIPTISCFTRPFDMFVVYFWPQDASIFWCMNYHGEAFYDHGRVGCINAGLMRWGCSALPQDEWKFCMTSFERNGSKETVIFTGDDMLNQRYTQSESNFGCAHVVRTFFG